VGDLIPLPGDFCCVSVRGETGRLIGAAEKLGGGFSDYQHVFGYIGDMRVVEAAPGGARVREITTFQKPGQLTLWSTGAIELTGAERGLIVAAALKYAAAKTGYSALDYVAIALHHLHVPAPGLRGYIAATGHMICSQLWDQAYLDAGVHLFTDGRWPGYVDPADLAGLIESAPRWGLRRDGGNHG